MRVNLAQDILRAGSPTASRSISVSSLETEEKPPAICARSISSVQHQFEQSTLLGRSSGSRLVVTLLHFQNEEAEDTGLA